VKNFTAECTRCKNLLPHIRFVATVTCKSVRHKNYTYHAILAQHCAHI